MKTITKALQEAMKSYGSVYAVARDSGLHQAQLQRFANGERSLHLDTADRLAAFFKLELRPIRKPKAADKAKKGR
jgi:plasmid maintenance system antidote protein VapI